MSFMRSIVVVSRLSKPVRLFRTCSCSLPLSVTASRVTPSLQIQGRLTLPSKTYSTATTGTGTSSTAEEERAEERGYQQEDPSAEDDDERRFRNDLLELALTHVKTTGWSVSAISKAAEQAGMSPSVGSLFTDSDLVVYFVSKSNRELEEHLRTFGPEQKPTLREAIEWRLRKILPYVENYQEAVALLMRPDNAQKSVQLLLEIGDSVAFHALKDRSSDVTWYSKRFGVALIYVSTELCLLQDTSEGFTDTWKFLERRCQDYEKSGFGELRFTSAPIPDILNVGFTTMMNILGRNAQR